jgi:DNA-binding SARP family transcriptional activator/tetratricopeptide (TPR) repeat protein
MEFRILGPLEAVADDGRPLRLGGHRPRALLTLLIQHASEVVSTDALVDALWVGRPPATAVKILQVYVSRLRKQLPPDRLVTKPPGYLLRVEPDELDSKRFERLAQAGRQALEGGRHTEGAETLREALGLWRGPPLADCTFEPFAQAEIARLTELRVTALEDRIEADLTLGRHSALVGELEALVSQHPLRERLHGQRMLALYRCGRQAEALGAYRRMRAQLVEELGLEPGKSLQDLERAILRQDPSLEGAIRTVAEAGPAARARRVRKTVTVLSLELTTPDGALDPEVATRIATRAWETVDRALARHQGILHARSGGRMTAVFGTPTAHEDDALRAGRAALGLRAALADGAGPTRARLELHAGIEAGTVLAAETPNTRSGIVGGVIDAAAHLSQAAPEGEILVGEGVEPLLRLAARLEPVTRTGARRRSDRPAWRLLDLTTDLAIPRRLDAPMVGREAELRTLVGAFEQTVSTRTPRLFTLLGAAGIGKSRLAAELRTAVEGRARVLWGRCLPYGEGITFWPLKEAVDELVKQDRGETLAELLAGADGADLAAERLASLVGAADSGAAGSEETVWAVRRLFEALGRRRPLVVVFDDCQWAEQAFLDLVEATVESARDASLFVVALARPEVLDDRASWPGERATSDSLLLEPLSERDCELLMRDLGADGALTDAMRKRIAEAAEGNPLFIEQMVAMLREPASGAEFGVPPNIHALLAARLDRLPLAEHELLGAASVVGKEFSRGAVAQLLREEDRAGLSDRLDSLLRKHLIVPGESIFPGDDAFRFRHILVRDAAYEALPKERRADLHERFADWLERAAPDRIREFEEILGYHLEQAHRYRLELGLPREGRPELPARAADRLASAGRRAYARGDVPGTVNLLARAAALLPDDLPARLELLIELGDGVRGVGDLERAESILSEAVERSSRLDDRVLEWKARLAQVRLRSVADLLTTDARIQVAERAIAVLEPLGAYAGLARAWLELARAAAIRGQVAEAEDAAGRALDHAERARDATTYSSALHSLLVAYGFGPTPVPEAIQRCEEVLHGPQGRRQSTRSAAFRVLALLKAMRGHFGEARDLLARDRALVEDLGLPVAAAVAVAIHGLVELLAGKPAEAEREFRAGLEALEQIGHHSGVGEIAALLGRAAYDNGRYDEAFQGSRLSEERAAPDDVQAQVQWRGPRAKVLARRGVAQKSEELAREAVSLAEQTDFLDHHADALMDLAEVLRLLGRHAEADRPVKEAIRLYRCKGNVTSAARAMAELRQLPRGEMAVPGRVGV